MDTNKTEPISARMDASCAVAIQFVDWEVMPAPDKLNREELHDLAQKIVCVRQEDFYYLKTRITVKLIFVDGVNDVVEMVETPWGVQPKMSNKVGVSNGRAS